MSSKYELQNLLRKMGGTPGSGDNTDETIKKITEVYDPSGGGSGVPEGGTIGQILRKNSSEDGDADWDSDTYVITITYASSKFTSDKKYLEIRQKISQGVPVIVRSDYLQTPNNYVYYQLDNAINVYIDFVRTDYYGENGAKIYRQRFSLQRDHDSEYPYVSYFSGYVAQPNDNRLIPSGGSPNQALIKNSGAYYDVKWGSPIASNGVPSGGTTGQVLRKKSGTDYDTKWESVYGIPNGGTYRQVLLKLSSNDYQVGWETLYTLPSGGTQGQVLTKDNSYDGSCSWQTISGGASSVEFLVYESSGRWYCDDSHGLTATQVDFLSGRDTDSIVYLSLYDDNMDYSEAFWSKSYTTTEDDLDFYVYVFSKSYIDSGDIVVETFELRWNATREAFDHDVAHQKATVSATVTT